jgi:hypothetical protein
MYITPRNLGIQALPTDLGQQSVDFVELDVIPPRCLGNSWQPVVILALTASKRINTQTLQSLRFTTRQEDSQGLEREALCDVPFDKPDLYRKRPFFFTFDVSSIRLFPFPFCATPSCSGDLGTRMRLLLP